MLFCLGDGRNDRLHYCSGYLVLHIKNLRQITIVSLGPDVPTRLGVNKLCSDTNPIGIAPHTALDKVADAKFCSRSGAYQLPDPCK